MRQQRIKLNKEYSPTEFDMKTFKISPIYAQIAEKMAKKKGKKMDNFISDLISEEFQR